MISKSYVILMSAYRYLVHRCRDAEIILLHEISRLAVSSFHPSWILAELHRRFLEMIIVIFPASPSSFEFLFTLSPRFELAFDRFSVHSYRTVADGFTVDILFHTSALVHSHGYWDFLLFPAVSRPFFSTRVVVFLIE